MTSACGGVAWGAMAAALLAWDFVSRGVPVLERYCVDNYGQQHKRIQKEVPYKLFPGIYRKV
jgi:hypothetical protein